MPDPQVLYVVTAVVVLALVAWVVVVLARAPALEETKGAAGETPAPTPQAKSEPVEAEQAASADRPSKAHLDAHMEIQDEKDGGDGPRDA
jgi:hypothetical protein